MPSEVIGSQPVAPWRGSSPGLGEAPGAPVGLRPSLPDPWVIERLRNRGTPARERPQQGVPLHLPVPDPLPSPAPLQAPDPAAERGVWIIQM